MAGIGACYGITACIVVFINLILFIVGFILAALGGVLTWGYALVEKYALPMMKSMMSSMMGNKSLDVEQPIKEMFEFLRPLAIGLLVIGVILLVIGFCGMCGPCCQSKCLLGTYILITLGIFVMELIVLVLFMTKRDEYIQKGGDYFKNEIEEKYQGITGTTFVSFAMNAVQMFLQCCGVYNGTDFEDAKKWKREQTVTYGGENRTITLEYPVTCCKMKGMKPVDKNCTFDPTPQNSNYQTGCLSKIFGMVENYMVYVKYGLIGLCSLQGLLLLSGVLLMYHVMTKDNKVHDSAKH